MLLGMTHREVRLSLDLVSLLLFQYVLLHSHIGYSLYLELLGRNFSRRNSAYLVVLEPECISKNLSNLQGSRSFQAHLMLFKVSLPSNSAFIYQIWLIFQVLTPTSNQLSLTSYPNHTGSSSIWVFLFSILIYLAPFIVYLNTDLNTLTRLSSIRASSQAIQLFHISFYHSPQSNCF